MSHFASASGGLCPQTPYQGFAPGPHWGTFAPRPPGSSALKIPDPPPLNPFHCKMWHDVMENNRATMWVS